MKWAEKQILWSSFILLLTFSSWPLLANPSLTCFQLNHVAESLPGNTEVRDSFRAQQEIFNLALKRFPEKRVEFERWYELMQTGDPLMEYKRQIESMREGKEEVSQTVDADIALYLLAKQHLNQTPLAELTPQRLNRIHAILGGVEMEPAKKVETMGQFYHLFDGRQVNAAEIETLTQSMAGKHRQNMKSEMEADFQTAWKGLHLMLKRAKNHEETVVSLAMFYRFMANGQPFHDGNIRMARMLVTRALNEHGYASPLWGKLPTHKRQEVYSWMNEIDYAIKLGVQFHHNLRTVLEAGYDYRYTPSPVINKNYLKELGIEAEQFYPLEFAAWVKIHERRFETVSEAVKEFVHWRKSFTYEAKENEQLVPGTGIRLFDELSKQLFMTQSKTRELFDLKMKRYYTEQTLYRGGTLWGRMTDAELVQLFLHPKMYMTQPRAIYETSQSRAEFLKGLDKWNDLLINDPNKLSEHRSDHLGWTGKLQSWFMSFSDTRSMAEKVQNGQFNSSNKEKVETGFLVAVRARKNGSMDNNLGTERLPYTGRFQSEREISFYAGIDPESITEINLKDFKYDAGLRFQHRQRTARRIDYNTIEIEQTLGEHQNQITRTRWTINPDGSVRQLF